MRDICQAQEPFQPKTILPHLFSEAAECIPSCSPLLSPCGLECYLTSLVVLNAI